MHHSTPTNYLFINGWVSVPAQKINGHRQPVKKHTSDTKISFVNPFAISAHTSLTPDRHLYYNVTCFLIISSVWQVWTELGRSICAGKCGRCGQISMSNNIRIDNAAMPFSRLTNYQLSMELQPVRQAVTEKMENNDFFTEIIKQINFLQANQSLLWANIIVSKNLIQHSKILAVIWVCFMWTFGDKPKTRDTCLR